MNAEIAAALRAEAAALVAIADAIDAAEALSATETGPAPPSPDTASWRSRLWTEPPERRIGVEEVAEALGRSTSWVYKNVTPGAEGALPVRRFGGELVFLVGEVRAWLETNEELVNRPPRAMRAIG